MELFKTSSQTWTNIKCKSSNKKCQLELSQCNVSFGKLNTVNYRHFSTDHRFIFRKDAEYIIPRNKIFYDFPTSYNYTARDPFELTFYSINVQFLQNSKKIPDLSQELIISQIPYWTDTTDAEYSCKDDIETTKIQSETTDSQSIIDTTCTTDSESSIDTTFTTDSESSIDKTFTTDSETIIDTTFITTDYTDDMLTDISETSVENNTTETVHVDMIIMKQTFEEESTIILFIIKISFAAGSICILIFSRINL
ncbi:hypothetical protein RF11_00748 [Thelohanellus kitauei]|uniref:Uncharacterized protein n=1 Tax=Thelohanellus kitauei TaxID=669202 RepID=A0A0C2JNA4_THEKT|nr:hypothetical protein RF11_00748 [Thelohanellus kitauei]